MAKKSTRKKESLYGCSPVTSGAFKGGVSVRGVVMPKPVHELLIDLERVKSEYENFETSVTEEDKMKASLNIIRNYKGSYIDSAGNIKGIVSFDGVRDFVDDAVQGELHAIREKINELNNKFDEARMELNDDTSSQLLFIYFVKGIGFSGEANVKTDFSIGLSDGADKYDLDTFHDAYNDVIIDLKKTLTQEEDMKIKKEAKKLCDEFSTMIDKNKSCHIGELIPELYFPSVFFDYYDYSDYIHSEDPMDIISGNLIKVSSKRCHGDVLECHVGQDALDVSEVIQTTLDKIQESHSDEVDFSEVRDSIIFINGENFSVTSFEMEEGTIVSTTSFMNSICRYGASQDQARDFILDNLEEISSKCKLTIQEYDRASRKYVTHDFLIEPLKNKNKNEEIEKIQEKLKGKDKKKELEKIQEKEKQREVEEKERLERIYEEAYAREAERLQREHQRSYVRPELPQYRVVSYEDERPKVQEQIPISSQARSEEPRQIEQDPEIRREQIHEKQSSTKRPWDVAKASAKELEDLLAKSRDRSLRKQFQREFRKKESREPRRGERGEGLY